MTEHRKKARTIPPSPPGRGAGGEGSPGESIAFERDWVDAVNDNWSPLDADCAARIYGIYPLGDQHWRAIGAIREEYLRTGSPPDPSTLCHICGLPNSELAELFPNTSTTLYALAGVPAPKATTCTCPAPLDRAE